MPTLPIPRIMPGNFEATSVDFAGPLTIRRCGHVYTHRHVQPV